MKANTVQPNREPAGIASLETFRQELGRLVQQFTRHLSHYKSGAYDEASLRQEFPRRANARNPSIQNSESSSQ
jgi:hypothetical protein